jgi:hypothetical protein
MENNSQLSRRSLLKAGVTTMAIAPLAVANPSLGQLITAAASGDATIPVTVGGRLLATSIAGVPPYVIESDRGTGFLPIYIRNGPIDPSLVGQHISVSGMLTSGACTPPALALVNPSGATVTPPPSPFIPDCSATLLEEPLTPQEEATLQALLGAYIGAVFFNNDAATAAMFRDQATQALTDPTFANYIINIPFISIEDDTQCPCMQCYSFSDFVDLVAASDGSQPIVGMAANGALVAIPPDCLRKILVEILCLVLGLLVAYIPREAVAEMERQAAALIADPRVRQAVTNVVTAAQRVIAGGYRDPRIVIDALLEALKAMFDPLTRALLAVIRTLRWAQAILAAAQAAAIWIKALIVIAKSALFIWKLIDIVKTCTGSGALCPAPMQKLPTDMLADLTPIQISAY